MEILRRVPIHFLSRSPSTNNNNKQQSGALGGWKAGDGWRQIMADGGFRWRAVAGWGGKWFEARKSVDDDLINDKLNF